MMKSDIIPGHNFMEPIRVSNDDKKMQGIK